MEMPCLPSESSPGTAGSQSACCVITTRSDCSSRGVPTQRLAIAITKPDSLLAIESEASEPAPVMVRPIAAARVAELTGTAAGYEPQFITPVIQPLYHERTHRLCTAGIAITGPGFAYYEDTSDEAGAIKVHAARPRPWGRRPGRTPRIRTRRRSALASHR